METKILDQEKFDTMKELVDMQTNLSNGRATLKKLEETTEVYMITREVEAEERVLKVLRESCDVLEEININHKELSGYNQKLQAYANELDEIASTITTLFKDFNEKMREVDDDVKKHFKSFNELQKRIKLDQIHIREDNKQLDRDRNEIRDGFRFLKDRRKLLNDGFAELKKLKTK